MKPLLFVLTLGVAGVLAFAAGDSPAKQNLVKPGMSFADATKVLSAAGLTGKEGQLDVINPAGIATRYFRFDRNVALEIEYTEETGKITSVSLMTSPTNRPIKGLEVYLPLHEIAVEADGSYRAHFASPRAK